MLKAWSSWKMRPSVLNAAVASAAAVYRVRPRDIMDGHINRPTAHARQLAMWKLREIKRMDGEPAYGWLEIGRRFKRDHTTAINAHRRVESRLASGELRLP